MARVPECGHPERRHGGFGLCSACYTSMWRRDGPRDRRPSRVADCHPDRRHMSRGLCGPCYSIQWRNGSGYRESQRDTRLTNLYGLGTDGYNNLLMKQGGKCAVCGEVSGSFKVDHDHDTGLVRGLLCNKCNLGLGHFKDDPLLLSAAAQYIASTTPLGVL